MKHYTNTINYELEKTGRLLRYKLMQLFNNWDIDMTIEEYQALDTIYCNQEICQRDLAKMILKDRASTGRILSSLEEKGYIKRFADTKNNRLVKKMQITTLGTEKLILLNEKFEEHAKNVIPKDIMKEIEKLHASLKKFRLELESAVDMKI